MSASSSRKPPKFLYRTPSTDDVEDVQKYVPGGFHPVDIGDVLGAGDKQYEVIHKLGHGGFSTVWLVRSCRHDFEAGYFALKVLTASWSSDPGNELRILQHLKDATPGHPNVVALHDSFKVKGPNGEHHCLLFPALGPSLHNSDLAKSLSAPARHRVCQQVASGMAFLHERGICHGDLTMANVVFELPDIRSKSPAEIVGLLGPIKAEKLKLLNRRSAQDVARCSPYAPKCVIESPDLSGLDWSTLSNIRIVEFGQAFFANDPPSSLGTPIQYFPPELCFGLPPGVGSDIWHLACVLYKVHEGSYLFPVFFPVFEMLLGYVVEYLGPLPMQWRGRFKYELYGYSEKGKEQTLHESRWWYEDRPIRQSLEDQLSARAPHLSATQRKEFVKLLFDMLALEPEKRVSATEVVRRLTSSAISTDDS